MSYATGYGIIVGSMWISAAIDKENWAVLLIAAVLTGDYIIRMWTLEEK